MFSNSTIDGPQEKLVQLSKNGVSQEYIGLLIQEKIQMYILTRAELLYTLCHEIPCSTPGFENPVASLCCKLEKFSL